MKSEPLVSVVIPIHNGAPFLEETLQSVFDQTYQNYEIITINHGSTDNSKEVLSNYTNLRYFEEPQLGNGHARNSGIEFSRGEYIAFLDQDDLWMPTKLTKQVEALERDPEALFAISHFQYFLSQGCEIPPWCRLDGFTKELPDHSPSGLVVKRQAFDMIGKFPESMRYASDMEWFFLANDQGAKKIVVPEVLHKRRVHQNNQSFDAQPIKSEILKVLRNSVQRKKASRNSSFNLRVSK